MSTLQEVAPPAATALATGPVDEVFTIRGLSWDQYVAIGDALGDHAALRTLFLDGSLTFVSPGYAHEWPADALDKILLAVAVGCEIDLGAVGSTTLRRGEGAGLEGDRTYYLGPHVELVGRPERIDLTIHPPPDLAIEVENTHQATEALGIYARLGVPEVWRHSVPFRSLTFWGLGPDGEYRSIERSLGFPFLSPVDVLEQLQQAAATPSGTRWFTQLTEWVRDVIRPRLDAGLQPEEERP